MPAASHRPSVCVVGEGDALTDRRSLPAETTASGATAGGSVLETIFQTEQLLRRPSATAHSCKCRHLSFSVLL